MPNWIAIVKLDLYNAAAAAYVDSADQKALGAGQASRSAAEIADVTAEIRAAVARNGMVDANTAAIPFSLKNMAVDTIILRLKKALNIELEKDEVDNLVRYDRKLEKIIQGTLSVEAPDNPIQITMQGGSSTQSQSQRRKATARKLNGLI